MVVQRTPSAWQCWPTRAHSCAASARKPWSTVATSNWPGTPAFARSSIARLSGPPDTASPTRASSGNNRASACRKRRTGGGGKLSAAGDLAAAPVILFFQPPGGERGIGFAELGERDAGAVGVVQRGHRFSEEQQAVGRAGAVLVGLVILEEVGRGLARLAVVEIGPAEQVAAEAGARVARISLDEQRQLLLRLGIIAGIPQPEAVRVLVVASVAGLRLGDRLHRGDPLRAGSGRAGLRRDGAGRAIAGRCL